MEIFRSPFPLVLILAMFVPQIISAQEVIADSVLYENALASTTSKAMRSLKKINNGKEYADIAYSLKHGHPFFQSEHIQSGELTYYAVDYSNVDFQYDLIKDKIVVDHVGGRRIALVNEKVSHFTIFGQTFKRIDDNAQVKPGFYQFLVDGNSVKLIASRRKKIDGYDRNKFPYITESVDYYLVKGGEYTFVRNYKNIQKLLGSEEDLSAAGQNRSATDEEKMVAVVKHYERLNK